MASSKPFSETALNSVTRATLICLCASLTPSLLLQLICYVTQWAGCQTSKGPKRILWAQDRTNFVEFQTGEVRRIRERRSSQNSGKAKFAEFPFYDVG